MTNKMGRPKNKIPTEQVSTRLPKPVARWYRKSKENKQKVVDFIERQLRK